LEALEGLRQNHAPEDHNSILKLYKRLYGLKLGPREDPIALINRAHDITTQLKDLKEAITESQVCSAVVAALENSPLHSGTVATMQTVGGEITINRLMNAFQNAGVPKIAGALNAEGEEDVSNPQHDFLSESIANLSKVANQIKKHVHKRWTPYEKKRGNGRGHGGQHDQQHGGRGQQHHRGSHQGGYQGNRGGYHGGNNPTRGGYGGQQYQNEGNMGGYQGRGGPRGRGGRVSFGRGNGRNGPFKCHNCGKTNHHHDDCFLPCGACGNRYHKFYDCHLNPLSSNYTGHKGQYSRANQAIDTSTLGEDIPHANFAHAFNSYHPLPEELPWDGPPGYEPGQVNKPVDPNTHFHNIGVASSVSVLKKSPDASVSHKWYMDGGASHHFTPHKYMLHDYVPDTTANPVFVRVATHNWTRRAGVGTIKVETVVNGKSFFKAIKNVWHVPEFAHSLLSVNMLKAQGCWGIVGRKGSQSTMDDFYFDERNQLWLVAKFDKGLNVPDWKLYLPSVQKSVNPTTSPSPASHNNPSASYARPNHATDKETPQLWHQRLGHVDMRSLQYLVHNKKVTGVKVHAHALRKHQHGPACKICVMSRHNRSPFHERREKATEILHTVHSDVCGPYSVPSLGGGAYVVTLVDEYSGKVDVSVVKSKDVVPDELRRMILTWENKTGKTVKVLFSDRGGEYINHVHANWCASKGIQHVFSVPRTPEQNGIAERLNQTLNNIVRALLFQYKLYMPLWGHAIIYACMLYNVRMHKHLKITHEEAFSGKIPDLSNFRTFGCLVYARVADSARKKA
jgi:transposase InsO family protein